MNPRKLASLLLVVLTGFIPIPAMGDGPETEPPSYYIYRGEAVELPLLPAKMALRYERAATPAARSQALATAGLAVKEATSIGDGRWHMLELEQPLAGAAETRLRVAGVLDSSEIEFASPVFRGLHEDSWVVITQHVLLRFLPEHALKSDVLLPLLAPGMDVVQKNFGNMAGAYRLRSHAADGFEVLAQANRLASDPRVAWAEPDMLVSMRPAMTPDDPLFPFLWHVRNTGQFGGLPGMDIDADLAWDITTGSPTIKVLVMDSSAQRDHPDLVIDSWMDFITPGGDVPGFHGTAVAGIIGATQNNGLGTSGIAPDVRVMSARVAGGGDTVSHLVDALAWGESEGARVSNASLGPSTQSNALDSAYQSTYDNGMVHFSSAGNQGLSTVTYPASLPTVNAVANVMPNGKLYQTSNHGPDLAFSAPGTGILTTNLTGSGGPSPTDYVAFTGTSAASPVAAAVAALLLSLEPTLTPPEVEAKMRCSSRDLGDPGFDDMYGWGMVNAYAALLPSGVDLDADGTEDPCDNCRDEPNADQADFDGDGNGDACDSCPYDFFDDIDADGWCADVDNCPELSNHDQADPCLCAPPVHTFDGEAPNDLFGWKARGAGDVDADGVDDIIIGAPLNSEAGLFAGKAYVRSGKDGSLLYSLLGEAAGDQFGVSVAEAGDLNGDGFDDVVVGAYYNDVNFTREDAGRAYVFHGGPGPFPSTLTAASADVIVSGVSPGDNFGTDVAGIEDVDGDSFPDFIVGARGASNAGPGAAYVCSGQSGAFVRTFTGEADGDLYGHAVASVEDIDADGVPEIVIGAPGHDPFGIVADAGMVDVRSGATGFRIIFLAGNAAGDQYGHAVAGADLTGDGVGDLVVGAPFGGAGVGRVYVISGSDWSAVVDVTGDELLGQFGFSVSATGDLDDDGLPDVIAAADKHFAPGKFLAGRVYAISSQNGAILDVFDGEGSEDSFGHSVDGRYDVNGDDVPDLIVSAQLAEGAGRTYVFLLPRVDTDGDGYCRAEDNCENVANPSQADQDLDGLGDDCDNCPLVANVDQFDLVHPNGIGDACDDPDADGVADLTDNCPDTDNFDQTDIDGDEKGDACDPCPAAADDDIDGDGACGDVDNCPLTVNPAQANEDGDTLGNVCDLCPGTADGGDDDGDGAGNACDCRPKDPFDLAPGAVSGLVADRSPAGATLLSWTAMNGADAYSVTRTDLSLLGSGSYGGCLAEGVQDLSFTDPSLPSPGQGFAYLVQGQSYECGLGLMGFDSDEQWRTNTDVGACVGSAHVDAYAESETAVLGVVTGSFADTSATDDVVQSIQEELSGGSPQNRFSQLEHQWTFQVSAGTQIELHVEGFRTTSPDGDDFVFEYWNGASWIPVATSSLPVADDDVDLVGALPSNLSGAVTIRVVDTDRTAGNQDLDTVAIDELFVRSIP